MLWLDTGRFYGDHRKALLTSIEIMANHEVNYIWAAILFAEALCSWLLVEPETSSASKSAVGTFPPAIKAALHT